MNQKSNVRKVMVGLCVVVMLAFVVFIAVPALMPKKEEPEATQAQAEAVKETTTAQDTHPGQARSKITGQWIDENVVDQVPFAVMYSNIKDAMPQSSIRSADVVYESLVEGGITRLCCVFENQTGLDKIGPVRSCRTFYLLFAKEFEAVYTHFGYSEYAANYLAQSKFHSLDGMVYCNFYRTDDRVAPHNAYTSWAGILESAQAKGYSLKYPDGYVAPFTFNTDDKKEVEANGGTACNKFYPGYPYNKPWFEYDEASKEYKRFQFDGPQIDKETGEQLSFKNILVKYVAPDYYENGTPNYKIDGNGKGLYITDGKAAEVTWVKDSETQGPTKYYYADGSEVVMNQGKTFICQIENTQEVTILDQ